MSFGGKKKSNNVKKATKPVGFNSAFGSLSGNTYTVPETQDQIDTRNLTDSKLLGTIKALPNSFDINSYYNNPFYQSTVDLFSQPINRRYEQDSKALNDRLSASNQLGSSYDAYTRSLLQQDRDYNLSQADLQGRQASAQAYQQQFQNNLAQLAGLRNERSAYQNQYYQPLTLANAYQQSVTPLQAINANYIAGQAQNQSGINYPALAFAALKAAF